MQSFLSTSTLCSSITPLSKARSRAAFRPCISHSDACFSGMSLQSRSDGPAGGRLRVVVRTQYGVSRDFSVTCMAGTSQSLRRNSPSSLICNCMPGGLRHVVRKNVTGLGMFQSCSRGTAKLKTIQRIGCPR